MTRSVKIVELTMQPIIGAAIRFMTLAPVPVVLQVFEHSGPNDARSSAPHAALSTSCYVTGNLS